jgi:precorrin-3B C17-methyltransferase
MSKIYVIGIGPGGVNEITPRAQDALRRCDFIVGYTAYVNILKDDFADSRFISTGMTREVERCQIALQKAREGYTTGLISSGDSGIYGMAGLMLEIVNLEERPITVEVIPGITAASSAAAILGAPLMNDFAVISLSDYLTPWDVIFRRIQCTAVSDLVICIYNPKSRNRTGYINVVRDELLKYRAATTPVGMVWNAGRKEENFVITNLGGMLDYDIDMFTTVIVGNSQTYVKNGRMITPRGYKICGGI